MKKVSFEQDEMLVMAMFDAGNRRHTLERLEEVIPYVRDDEEVYLLTIYYKKDDNRTPTNQEIIELVETYCM